MGLLSSVDYWVRVLPLRCSFHVDLAWKRVWFSQRIILWTIKGFPDLLQDFCGSSFSDFGIKDKLNRDYVTFAVFLLACLSTAYFVWSEIRYRKLLSRV